MFDDMLDPALPIDPGPTTAVAPQAPAVGKSGGADRFKQILQVVLPALAATYALKKGSGLGEYAGGMMRGQEHIADQDDRLEQRRLQREGINRQIAQYAAQEARQKRIDAENEARHLQTRLEQQQAIEDAKNRSIHDTLQHALDKATENPEFMDKVNKGGAENFVLAVPGLGNMNLREAFDRLGVVKGPDGYSYGRAPAPEKTPLITGYGSDGKTPTRVPDGPNVRVYQRPRAPREAPKDTTRAYTWKDDDPSSDSFGQSFRIVEDEKGNIKSKTRLTGETTAPPKTDTPAPAPAAPAVGGTKVGRFTVVEHGKK